MDQLPHILLGLLIGVSLAAACGFRVFVPMLVMSVAAKAGMLELSDGWDWIASWPAIAAFGAATGLEIAGYYIPWVDNLLDSVSSPAAVVAGTVAVAACVSELHPLLAWSAGVIAGGGMAGAVQATTVVTRGALTTTTAGFGNFLLSTLELVISLALAVLAIIAPLVAGLAVCLVVVFVGLRFMKRRIRQSERRADLELNSKPAK